MSEELQSTSLVQRIVLCCLVTLEDEGKAPVDTAQLREVISDHLDAVEGETVGQVTEADVMRALNGLSETDLVDETRPEDRSPVGKGRPQYSLGTNLETVREAMADDERVAGLLG